MEVRIEMITPQMAEEWLRTSNGNPRYIRKGKTVDIAIVERIERDIRNGKWVMGNNSIAFLKDGTLIDGHHRLSAIVKAGVPVQSIVVYGIEDDGKAHIDENRVRTKSARTGLSSLVVSTINLHYTFEHGEGEMRAASAEWTMEFARNHPLVEKAVVLSERGKTLNRGIARKQSITHACFLALESGEDEKEIQRFCEVINNGMYDEPRQNTAVIIRNHLLSDKFTTSNKSKMVVLEYNVERAIFDFIHGDGSRKRMYNESSGIYWEKLKKDGWVMT